MAEQGHQLAKPSYKLMCDVVEKIKILKAKKEEFQLISSLGSKIRKPAKARVTVEQLINIASEVNVVLTNKRINMLFPDIDQITALVTPESIREQVKKPREVCRMPSTATPEESREQNFCDYVRAALKETTQALRNDSWGRHVQPLIDDIELDLFPYWRYFGQHGTWGIFERKSVQAMLTSDDPGKLSDLIKEFERFKHLIQTQSNQLSKEVPAETIPPIDLGKGEWWNCKSLKLLREIDSNAKRTGIEGTRVLRNDLRAYLKKHKRNDIADTLTVIDGRITTTIPYGQMFLQK
ncbi:MAG: hypothetical protein A2Y12_03630 [Planctomycetes bacterium GWF2_42_9]|nr:MAG: hypothetical protein A2Y12_03630 [Planctomycetes bacterium GWF2_42_9]